MVDVLHLTDPGCPWAWSASPAIAGLRWRFGSGLRWRHALIGLTERAEQYEERGYHPLTSAIGYQKFRRYGMPFAPHVKRRVSATSPACRTVVAARLHDPQLEWWTRAATHFDQNDWIDRAPLWVEKVTPGRANPQEAAQISKEAAEAKVERTTLAARELSFDPG